MARKTPQQQREELLEKKRQLEERLKALEAKQTAQKRKDDTRRKILAGAVVLHHAKLKPDFRKWLAGELNKALDKPHDRALFEDWFAEAAPPGKAVETAPEPPPAEALPEPEPA